MSRLTLFLIAMALFVSACTGGTDPLTANAGNDFSTKTSERPRFDGCASTGNIVNYKWTILSAPEKMRADAGKVIREIEPNCAFTLDAEMEVDEVGLWEIQLEVRDGEGNMSVDTVIVTVVE
jgi:hypothetical protein